MKRRLGLKICLWWFLTFPLSVIAQNDVPTQFSNIGGIVNTRHNMMQSTEASNNGKTMNAYRNRYGGVCVYCHTPHGANAAAAAPLWNRLLPAGSSFTTYDKLNTTSLTQTVYNPGAASLPCLSCHDGSQAIDAILNMPGSGNYSASANSSAYVPPLTSSDPGGYGKSVQHRNMGTDAGSCMACHAPDGGSAGLGVGVATDFTLFVIGKDLRNDHPVGVVFPATTGINTDWNTPNGTKVINGSLTNKFFDENGNGRMDKEDIRLYDSGSGASVECASCHDPHGVPGPGGAFNATFLRKPMAQSGVCLTCHAK